MKKNRKHPNDASVAGHAVGTFVGNVFVGLVLSLFRGCLALVDMLSTWIKGQVPPAATTQSEQPSATSANYIIPTSVPTAAPDSAELTDAIKGLRALGCSARVARSKAAAAVANGATTASDILTQAVRDN